MQGTFYDVSFVVKQYISIIISRRECRYQSKVMFNNMVSPFHDDQTKALSQMFFYINRFPFSNICSSDVASSRLVVLERCSSLTYEYLIVTPLKMHSDPPIWVNFCRCLQQQQQNIHWNLIFSYLLGTWTRFVFNLIITNILYWRYR